MGLSPNTHGSCISQCGTHRQNIYLSPWKWYTGACYMVTREYTKFEFGLSVAAHV